MKLGSSAENATPVIPFIGLKNVGNTCYLNSIIQVLYHCPYFACNLSKVLTAWNDKKGTMVTSTKFWSTQNDDVEGGLALLKELKSLFCELDANQSSLLKHGDSMNEEEVKLLLGVRPDAFVKCLRKLHPEFEPYTQQDAQECFHCILTICKSAVSEMSINKCVDKKPPFSFAPECKVVGGRKISLASVLVSSENKKHTTSLDMRVYSGDSTNNEVQEHPLLSNTKRKNDPENSAVLEKISPSTAPVNDKLTSEQSFTVSCFQRAKKKCSKQTKKQLYVESNHTSVRRLKRTSPASENALLFASDHTHLPPKKMRLGFNMKITSRKQNAILSNGLFGKSQETHAEKKTFSNKLPVTKLWKFHSKKLSVPKLSKPRKDVEQQTIKSMEETHLCDFVKETFQGELVATTKCMECETKVNRFETFQDISLPVKDVHHLSEDLVEGDDLLGQGDVVLPKTNDVCSLAWALTQFTSVEILDGNNKYFCDTCARLSEGEHSTRLHHLPPVLAFHLKRFSTTSMDACEFSTNVSKITSAFEIPRTMKFTEWCSRECVDKDSLYELFGIVVHSGTTITGGHYLTYVKYRHNESTDDSSLAEYNGRWLEIDDEQVRLLSEEEVSRALNQGDFELPCRSPYMVFYHKTT